MAGHFSGNPSDWSGGANAPHIARYFIARGWIEPTETVLDAGCGSGYGSWILAQTAKRVGGVDVDAPIIESAKKDWIKSNLSYAVVDLGKDELPDCDVLVSIEVPEHINGLEHFIEQAQKHTKRLMFLCAPVGGTSHAYTEKQKATPAGENNDFNNVGHLVELFSNDEWSEFTSFQFGYSGVAIMMRRST